MIAKQLILRHFLTLSDHTNLQDRWISDRTWIDIINEHLGLDEEQCITKHAFNKHMSTLKREQKIDIHGEVFITIRFKILDYSKNKTVSRTSFYYIKATKTKDIIYYNQNKTWEEVFNNCRVSLRSLPPADKQDEEEHEGE